MDLITNKYVKTILQGKHAFIIDSDYGEAITQFMNQRFSVTFHLSEQKAYLFNPGFPMRKSLSKQITRQINRM